ncbi:MAG: hypothetical protein KKD66_09680 [Proteobacteria bacterium]|nr:hypothetical protein [Pseudomonadota bacterium]MBU2454817.1 hypothetical protein [Pseudomonadota bacterium]MBU2628710.1 hypothetical protein [Pseudomonadota bacterium]
MFEKMFKFIKRRLWLRLLIPVSVIVIVVVFVNLWYNISFQVKSGETQLRSQNKMLAQAVEGGMFDALAIGDNDTVRNQFKRLNEKIKDLKVFVYDFNGKISFSTDINAIGREMKTFLDDESKRDVSSLLETGDASDRSFHVSVEDIPFLLENDPILNEERCFHCHGENRKVLGGISVFSSELAVKKAIDSGKLVSILIGLTGLSVIIAFIWLFFHFLVNKKVHMVLSATSNLRQKDFTNIYDIKEGDEINHILARINLVTKDLRQTIKQVVDNSGSIFNSASELSLISEDLNTASTDASQKATTVSAAAEEMSINNQSIATAMEQSTDTLNAIASAIEEMSATVSEIAQNVSASKQITEQVVQGFEIISQVVEELGERANDVDLVTDEIRSIAEQVSMLALNAKIEAARAGDAGKGFAVVAQEITDLANETNKSTLEADVKLRWIKEKSKEVTQKVTGLTAIVKESDDAISSISAAVEEQNATTREIAKNINDVSDEISDVNMNVTQGAGVAAQIAKEITLVEEGSRQVQESSNKLNDNAMALSAMAENFMELMKKFKV